MRVALGLQLDLEHVGVSAFGLFGTDSGKANGHGFTVAARISGERYPTLWHGPRHLEKIDLGPGLGSQRKLWRCCCTCASSSAIRRVAGVVVVLGDLDGGWATAEELRAAPLAPAPRQEARLRLPGRDATPAATTSPPPASASIKIRPAASASSACLDDVSSSRAPATSSACKADFVKIAEYKSAPEQYTRDGIVGAGAASSARQLVERRLRERSSSGIAAARHVAPPQVRSVDRSRPLHRRGGAAPASSTSCKAGDEVEDAIAEQLGRHVSHCASRRPRPSARANWHRAQDRGALRRRRHHRRQVADDPAPRHEASSACRRSCPRSRKRATTRASRPSCCASNSPGGSALASDLIARELERTARGQAGGLLVRRRGRVGRLLHRRALLPHLRRAVDAHRLDRHLHRQVRRHRPGEQAGRHRRALPSAARTRRIESLFRPYTDEERKLILDKLRYFYGRFVDAVARGRAPDRRAGRRRRARPRLVGHRGPGARPGR